LLEGFGDLREVKKGEVRPRKTLAFRSPAEVHNESLALTS